MSTVRFADVAVELLASVLLLVLDELEPQPVINATAATIAAEAASRLGIHMSIRSRGRSIREPVGQRT